MLVYSTKQEALDGIREYFKAHFHDYPTELARTFCKRSCNECYGRGTRTWSKVDATQGPGSVNQAELGYCSCVRKRLHQKAEELVRTRRLYAGGGP